MIRIMQPNTRSLAQSEHIYKVHDAELAGGDTASKDTSASSSQIVCELQHEVASLKDQIARLQAENDKLCAQAQCTAAFMQQWAGLRNPTPGKERLASQESPEPTSIQPSGLSAPPPPPPSTLPPPLPEGGHSFAKALQEEIALASVERDDRQFLSSISQGMQLRHVEPEVKGLTLELMDEPLNILGGGPRPADELRSQIALFPELKAGFLKHTETADKSSPVIDDGSRFTVTQSPRNKMFKQLRIAAERRSYEKLFKLRTDVCSKLNASGVGIARVLRLMDTNGDGVLSKSELSIGLARMEFPVDDAQLQDFFTLLDRDGDGEISILEFARWFGTGPPPAPIAPEVIARQKARKEAESWVESPREHLSSIKKEFMNRKLASKKHAHPKGVVAKHLVTEDFTSPRSRAESSSATATGSSDTATIGAIDPEKLKQLAGEKPAAAPATSARAGSQLGRAIHAVEEALKVDPGNVQMQRKLQMLRERL